MKEVNLNKYICNCYLLIGLLLVFYFKFEYEPEIEQIIIYSIGALIFAPFEFYCSKIMYHIAKKQNFHTKYLFSKRIVTIK